MKFGFHGINEGVLSEPEAMARVARAAEAAGYESLWTGERVVIVDPPPARSPLPADARIIDTIASLAFLAAHTTHVSLGSGVLLLPHRDPIVLAKELAAIDVLSRGRLIVGVGVGGNVRGELESIGLRASERGARTTEHIEAMRALWTQDQPRFQGRFTTFSGIQSRPRPVQKPHPPVLVGGGSDAAYRRAVQQGNGWYGFGRDVQDTAAAIAGLNKAADRVERPAELGRLSITVTPRGELDRNVVEQFEEMGVERLVLTSGWKAIAGQPSPGSEAPWIEQLHRWAEQLRVG